MSELAIRVENLSKRYRIGQGARAPYKTLRESLMGALAAPVNRLRSRQRISKNEDHIWALKDVSFEVNHGEVVGIIGRNGAGKTTLLKILSRITEPTSGSVDLYGRVGSLLEVGTGFHPELTGRENIYLNGAILGMHREEIERKFDEIVAFAEIEKFIDTPVKFYSSGMYVRLAFAVAAHLEPEILLVDEVLAVGDAAFQKKCLGKMEEVASKGRTVLYVSHNMNSVEKLCSRAILLLDGIAILDSQLVTNVIQKYLDEITTNHSSFWENSKNEFDNKFFRPLRLSIFQDGKPISGVVRNDKNIQVVIEGYVEQKSEDLFVGYHLLDHRYKLIFESHHKDGADLEWPRIENGYVRLVSVIPRRLLNDGQHYVKLVVLKRKMLGDKVNIVPPNQESAIVRFDIEGGMSDSSRWDWKRTGVIAPIIPWYSEN
jgi:lipopolysaccharide transport system ATP-binding protein